VTRLASLAAAPPPAIPPPHIEYWQLSPTLLVFGLAIAGVLVEAFVPRAQRRALHLGLTLSGLAGMFAMTRQVEVVRRWADGPDVITWFELSTETAGPLPVVNWSRVEDGRITRIRVTFDPRPLLG